MPASWEVVDVPDPDVLEGVVLEDEPVDDPYLIADDLGELEPEDESEDD